MVTGRSAIVLLAVLAIACVDRNEPQRTIDPKQTSTGEVTRALPSRDEFVRSGLTPGLESRGKLAGVLGEPDSIQAAAVPNRHDPGVTDTLFSIYYPGLVVRTHQPGGGVEIVASVDVMENRFLRHALLGARRGQVERAFGPPDEVRDGHWVYMCRMCVAADDPVELTFGADRLTRVRFTYYVD